MCGLSLAVSASKKDGTARGNCLFCNLSHTGRKYIVIDCRVHMVHHWPTRTGPSTCRASEGSNLLCRHVNYVYRAAATAAAAVNPLQGTLPYYRWAMVRRGVSLTDQQPTSLFQSETRKNSHPDSTLDVSVSSYLAASPFPVWCRVSQLVNRKSYWPPGKERR